MSESPSGVPDVSLTTPAPASSKQLALARDLNNMLGILAFRVASCDCPHKAKCKIYLQGESISIQLGKLQEEGEVSKSIAPATVKKGRGKDGSGRRNP